MKNDGKGRVRNGFTMVELMAVLIILGLLFAVVVQNFVGHTDKARVVTTRASLKLLHNAVNQFKMDTGHYPTDDEGLYALIEPPMGLEEHWQPGGYLETTDVPKDGWGNDFIYTRTPEGIKPFVVMSLGADGQEGGEGYDADLLSTDAS